MFRQDTPNSPVTKSLFEHFLLAMRRAGNYPAMLCFMRKAIPQRAGFPDETENVTENLNHREEGKSYVQE